MTSATAVSYRPTRLMNSSLNPAAPWTGNCPIVSKAAVFLVSATTTSCSAIRCWVASSLVSLTLSATVTCEVNGGLEIVEVRRPAVVTTDLRLDEPVTMEKDKIPAGGYSAMTDYPEDVYTEPSDFDVHTLKNLGPLTGLAGIWQGTRSLDVNPKAEGPEEQVFVERIELQPIDPQTNGPQLFYGLRYHTHIVKPGEVETYHDQVGYWLWEPSTGNVIQTVAIPRGQTVMAFGHAAKDATSFELSAERGVTTNGICSNPFLEEAFKTLAFRIRVGIKSHDAWTYDEDTTLIVRGQSEPFHHTDHGELTRVGEPTPNPLARG